MGGMPTTSSVAEEIAFRVVAPNLEVRKPDETASKSSAQPLPWVVRLTNDYLPSVSYRSWLTIRNTCPPTSSTTPTASLWLGVSSRPAKDKCS